MNNELLHELVMGKKSKAKKMNPLSSHGMSKVGKATNLMGMFPKSLPKKYKKTNNNMFPSMKQRSYKKHTGGLRSIMINTSPGKGTGSMMSTPKSNIGYMVVKTNSNKGLSSLMVNTKPMRSTKSRGSMSAMYIIGDRKTREQKNYLKNNKGTKRFGDFDKDGVINGLDCHWKDPTRHGFFTKSKNFATGRGFKENSDVAPNVFQEAASAEQASMEAERKKQEMELAYQQSQREAKQLQRKGEREEKVVNEELSKHQAKRIKQLREFSIINEAPLSDLYRQPENIWATMDAPHVRKMDDDAFVDQLRGEQAVVADKMQDAVDKQRWAGDDQKELAQSRRRTLPQFQRRAEEAEFKFAQASEAVANRPTFGSKVKNIYSKFGDPLDADFGQRERKFQDAFVQAGDKLKSGAKKAYDFTGRTVDKAEDYMDVAVTKADKLVGKGVEVVKEFGITRPGAALKHKLKSKGFTTLVPKGEVHLRDEHGALRYDVVTTKQKDGSTVTKKVPVVGPGYKKEFSVLGYLSGKTGRIFEDKDAQKAYREDAARYKRGQQIASGIRLAKKGAGITTGDIKQLDEMLSRRQITQSQYNQAVRNLSRQSQQIGTEENIQFQQKAEKFQHQLRTKPIQAEFDKQLYLDALRKQEASKVNIARAQFEFGNLQRASVPQRGAGLGDYLVGSPQQTRTGEAIAQQGFADPYTPRYRLENSPSSPFDINAPRFVYQRDANSFTRKTSRVTADDDSGLGERSDPSFRQRSGSAFHWTKPMSGWKRVQVGTGRHVGKGRQRRSRSKVIKQGEKKKFKVPKFKFEKR